MLFFKASLVISWCLRECQPLLLVMDPTLHFFYWFLILFPSFSSSHLLDMYNYIDSPLILCEKCGGLDSSQPLVLICCFRDNNILLERLPSSVEEFACSVAIHPYCFVAMWEYKVTENILCDMQFWDFPSFEEPDQPLKAKARMA